MKQYCSCGFIIAEVNQGVTSWLLCHPTNCGNRWDFPKGSVEIGEDHFEAAKRELFEETGLEIFFDKRDVIDLGQHSYNKKKDLHLFYFEVEKIDTRIMKCISMVQKENCPEFPEMDGFAVFKIDEVYNKIGESLRDWILAHVPVELKPSNNKHEVMK